MEEDKVAIAIEKAYWGNQQKSFFFGRKSSVGEETYTPNKLWQTDFHYVAYSAAGSDVNSLIVGLGQRLGTGLMSKESAREADPLISDPDLEHDRIISEGVESALLTSIQQQAADPNGPYQPEDLAYLTKLVVEQDVPLFEAVPKQHRRTDQCVFSADVEAAKVVLKIGRQQLRVSDDAILLQSQKIGAVLSTPSLCFTDCTGRQSLMGPVTH